MSFNYFTLYFANYIRICIISILKKIIIRQQPMVMIAMIQILITVLILFNIKLKFTWPNISKMLFAN